MKRRKQTATFILYVIVIFTIAAGCGKQKEPITDQPALETVEYSNLTDDDSRKQLSQLLSDAGIEGSRSTALMDRVEQFNASVKSEWLTDGFDPASGRVRPGASSWPPSRAFLSASYSEIGRASCRERV